MSMICGQNGLSWATPISELELNAAGGAQCLLAGYTALWTATATTAYLQCGLSGNSTTTFQICVYNGGGVPTGGGSLVATSASGTVVNGALVGVAISAPLIQGNTYTLLMSTQSGFLSTYSLSGSGAFVDSQFSAATFPFASVPNPLPNRTSGTGKEFIIWLDAPYPAPMNWVSA